MHNKILAFNQNNKEKNSKIQFILFLKLPFKLSKKTLKKSNSKKNTKIEGIMHFLTGCNGKLTSAKNDVVKQWIKCQ